MSHRHFSFIFHYFGDRQNSLLQIHLTGVYNLSWQLPLRESCAGSKGPWRGRHFRSWFWAECASYSAPLPSWLAPPTFVHQWKSHKEMPGPSETEALQRGATQCCVLRLYSMSGTCCSTANPPNHRGLQSQQLQSMHFQSLSDQMENVASCWDGWPGSVSDHHNGNADDVITLMMVL